MAEWIIEGVCEAAGVGFSYEEIAGMFNITSEEVHEIIWNS